MQTREFRSEWTNWRSPAPSYAGRWSGTPNRPDNCESLKLARAEATRQLEATTHEARKSQLTQAIAELDKRIKAAQAALV